VIDHRQCKECKYAKWLGDGKGHLIFNYCDHLSMTNTSHIVKDGVCKSKMKREKINEQSKRV